MYTSCYRSGFIVHIILQFEFSLGSFHIATQKIMLYNKVHYLYRHLPINEYLMMLVVCSQCTARGRRCTLVWTCFSRFILKVVYVFRSSMNVLLATVSAGDMMMPKHFVTFCKLEVIFLNQSKFLIPPYNRNLHVLQSRTAL